MSITRLLLSLLAISSIATGAVLLLTLPDADCSSGDCLPAPTIVERQAFYAIVCMAVAQVLLLTCSILRGQEPR